MREEQVLDKVFDRVESIPTFPKVAQQALELLREEDIDFKKLEKIIKSDPGIVANFLKIVNSPAFGLPHKIDSLFKAFMFLGVNQIKFIIIASVAKNYFNKDLKGYSLKTEEIWLHSITCGFIAEELAFHLDLTPAKIESIYIASILHDIGKIVLDLYMEIEEEEFYEAINEHPDWDFMQIEWVVLGVDHGLVGAHLLERWNFPKSITFAVRAHHDPDLMLQNDVASIVGLANALTNLLGIGQGIDSFYYKLPQELIKKLNLSREKLYKYLKIGFHKTLAFQREF